MTQINLTDVVFYKDGIPGQSEVVGVESSVSRVARYTFLAPETGGTDLTFQLTYLSKGGGYDIPIRFAITTDPESHKNADGATPYAGTVNRQTAQGSAQMRLLPGKTYYLWLFPGEKAWGWYYAPTSGTVTVTGISQGVATAADGVLGQPVDITILSVPGYTHRLTWEFAGQTGLIGEDLLDRATWTPSEALAAAIPNSPGGTCALTCYSYQNGIQVGEPQVSHITLSVPERMAPQVTCSLTDPSEAAQLLHYFVEKVSRLEVSVQTTLFYGATVISTAITLDGTAYAGAALTAGTHTLAVAVTDSRGLTGRWAQEIQVAAYTTPQLEITASRCRADGTADDSGDYALVTLTGAVAQIPQNTAALTLTYGNATLEISVAVGPFRETRIIPADPNETLVLRGRIVDAFKGVTRSMTLSTGYPTMEFLAGGKGVAFGMVPTGEGFQCGMDAQFFGKMMDGQGRTLAARYDLTPVTGMYLSPVYGRVLEVLGAGFLQLKFTCNRNRAAGDTLYTAALPIAEALSVTDTTGKITLTLTPTGVVTPNALPTGTYTFSCMLY